MKRISIFLSPLIVFFFARPAMAQQLDTCTGYLYKGQPLAPVDTLVISIEDWIELQDSLLFIRSEDCFPSQFGAVNRRGNPRRRRPNNRDNEVDFAFLEDWNYVSACCIEPQNEDKFLDLTVFVIDTTAPEIFVIPSDDGGLQAVPFDLDVARIISTLVDTIEFTPTRFEVLYTFEAIDFSGNTAVRQVALVRDLLQNEIYADFDGDGLGNPDISLFSSGLLDGYATNADDCNDEYVLGSSTVDTFLIFDFISFPVDLKCDGQYSNYDLFKAARQLPITEPFDWTAGHLSEAQPSILPLRSESCVPDGYSDVWFTFSMPASGAVDIQMTEDAFAFVDVTGFDRSFVVEIYAATESTTEIQWLECLFFDNVNFIDTTIRFQNPAYANEQLYARITEQGNKNDAPFLISLTEAELLVNTIDIKTNTLKLYPNPIQSRAVIHIDNLDSTLTHIARILNLRGQEVYSTTLFAGDNNLRLPEISTGTYILQLAHEHQLYVQKIVLVD